MKKVERTNMVLVCPNQWARFTPYNPYIMEVDCGNRNCYNYRKFGYLARNCRNRGIEGRIGKRRRLEYRRNENNGERRMIEGGNRQNNLNGDRDLVVVN